jgi:hypothetical protein
MKKTLITGNIIVSTKTGDVFSAESLASTSAGLEITFGGKLTGTIATEDLAEVFSLEVGELPIDQIRETSKIVATLLFLENVIGKYSESKGIPTELMKSTHSFSLFGSTSLSLTILPNRSSEDIDIIAEADFVDFINSSKLGEGELNIEVLEPNITSLLGNWQSRTSSIKGIKNQQFNLLHPLDTLTQKLLRLDPNKFNTKDAKDIKEIVELLSPSQNTLLSLLTENPNRYIENPWFKEQYAATKRNTTWFLNTFVGQTSFEDLGRISAERLSHTASKIGAITPLATTTLEKKFKVVKHKNLDAHELS